MTTTPSSPTQPASDAPAAPAPPRPPHPRVLTRRTDDGGVGITILVPRNPLRIGYLPSLIFGPTFTLVTAFCVLAVIGVRRAGLFVLALFACGVAWLVAELPGLMRGLHTRVELVIDPAELRATVRHLWSAHTHVYRRGQVVGVRDVSTGASTRGIQVRFTEGEPLEIMAGYPDDQIDAAVATLRRALADVPPAAPLLRADDPATLPYAGSGRSHEVEVRRFADGAGVSVTVPPVYNAGRTVGGVIFTLMWVIMLALLFQATGCWLAALFVLGGTWGLLVALREYARRDRPLVLVATPGELVIENGPWFASSRRVPREGIKSIAADASGRERRFVLAIERTRGRRIELMPEREKDEIERVAAALSESLRR